MPEENITHEFRLKNIDKTRTYLIKMNSRVRSIKKFIEF